MDKNIQSLAEAVKETTDRLEYRLEQLEFANKKLVSELNDEKKKSKQKIMEAQKFAATQVKVLRSKIVILAGKVTTLSSTISTLASIKSK